MTATAIYLLTICLMALDCVAVGTHHARWRVFTKPAPMIALIVWFSMTGLWQGGLIWFGIALVFSLLGDIFLLFPFRLFIAGLVAFSLAQIFYIIGLNSTGGSINPSVLMILVAVVIIAFLDFNPLLRRIRRRPSSRNLLLPVLFYAILLKCDAFFCLADHFSQQLAGSLCPSCCFRRQPFLRLRLAPGSREIRPTCEIWWGVGDDHLFSGATVPNNRGNSTITLDGKYEIVDLPDFNRIGATG